MEYDPRNGWPLKVTMDKLKIYIESNLLNIKFRSVSILHDRMIYIYRNTYLMNSLNKNNDNNNIFITSFTSERNVFESIINR